MAYLTVEAVCSDPECKAKIQSLVFRDQGIHYCTECGSPLIITDKVVYSVPDKEYRQFKQYKYYRNKVNSKKC